MKNNDISREKDNKGTSHRHSEGAALLQGFAMGLVVFGIAAALLLVAFFL